MNILLLAISCASCALAIPLDQSQRREEQLVQYLQSTGRDIDENLLEDAALSTVSKVELA